MLLTRIQKVLALLREPRLLGKALRLSTVPSLEHLHLLDGLKFKSIVDVGANVGQFYLLSRWLWPDAVIVSIEPLRQQFAMLARAGRRDELHVRVESALGDRNSQGSLNVAEDSDSSSLLRASDSQLSSFPNSKVVNIQDVEIVRFDSLDVELVRPALLKLDVQGYELSALRGFGQRLNDVDAILVELSFRELYEGQSLGGEVLSFLHDAGFSVVRIGRPMLIDGRPEQVDVLLCRR